MRPLHYYFVSLDCPIDQEYQHLPYFYYKDGNNKADLFIFFIYILLADYNISPILLVEFGNG